MMRLISPNGATVNVDDEFGARLLAGFGYTRPSTKTATAKTSGSQSGTTPDTTPATKYDGLKADELRAAIDERNDDGRDDDAKLSKTGNKPDLVKVLVADDEAQAAAAAAAASSDD